MFTSSCPPEESFDVHSGVSDSDIPAVHGHPAGTVRSHHLSVRYLVRKSGLMLLILETYCMTV